MDKLHKEKLADRITYLVFSIVMLLTAFFPMLSLKSVVGEHQTAVSSSISAVQVIKIGLMDKDELSSHRVSLIADVEEEREALIEAGSSAAQIEEALKTNPAYNELALLEAHMVDTTVLKPFAITMLITYVLYAALLLLFVASIIVRKEAMDIANIFANAGVSILAIVTLALSFSLTFSVSTNMSYLLCGEMMLYVMSISPVALVVVQVINLFLARRARKVKAEEINVSFTDNKE